MPTGVIKAKIFRYDPDSDNEPYFQDYEVPAEGQVSVHELLSIIHRDYDGTLAFRPYKCFKGTCSTCIVKLNGKSVKSCATQIDTNTEIKIEPVKSGPLIRDLVVDFNNM
jgi:succinate dehydrogenase / fumarate reductase iron-sulfur subunit